MTSESKPALRPSRGEGVTLVTQNKRGACSRCGGTDAVSPLPKRYACESCGQRGLCYACNVNHNVWCLT